MSTKSVGWAPAEGFESEMSELRVKMTRGALKVSASEIRHAFVDNVKLLGFKEEQDPYEERVQSTTRSSKVYKLAGSKRRRTPFGPLMFTEANPHGFHELIYFLFTRLNEDHYMQLFDTCWPPYDNQQVRAFRKLLLAELREFEKLGYIPRGLAQGSVLASAQGARADRLMWHLSTHVLREVLARDHGDAAAGPLSLVPEAGPSSDYPGETTNQQKARLRRLIRAAEAQADYREQQFRDKVEKALATKSAMKKKAEELTSEFRGFESRKVVLSEKLANIMQQSEGGSDKSQAQQPVSTLAPDLPAVEMLAQQWKENSESLESDLGVGWERFNASNFTLLGDFTDTEKRYLTAADILKASAARDELLADRMADYVVDGSPLARAVQKEESAERLESKGHSGSEELADHVGKDIRGCVAPAPVDLVDAIHHSVRGLEKLGRQFLGHSVSTSAKVSESRAELALPMRGLGDLEKLEKLAQAHGSYLEQSKALAQRLRTYIPKLQSSVDSVANGTGMEAQSKFMQDPAAKLELSLNANKESNSETTAASASTCSAHDSSSSSSSVSIRLVSKGEDLRSGGTSHFKRRATGKKFHHRSTRGGDNHLQTSKDELKSNTAHSNKAPEPVEAPLSASTVPHGTLEITPVSDSYDLPSIKAQLASLRKRLEKNGQAANLSDAPAAPDSASTQVPTALPMPAQVETPKLSMSSETPPRSLALVGEKGKQLVLDPAAGKSLGTPAWKAQTPVTYSYGKRDGEATYEPSGGKENRANDMIQSTPSKQLDFANSPTLPTAAAMNRVDEDTVNTEKTSGGDEANQTGNETSQSAEHGAPSAINGTEESPAYKEKHLDSDTNVTPPEEKSPSTSALNRPEESPAITRPDDKLPSTSNTIDESTKNPHLDGFSDLFPGATSNDGSKDGIRSSLQRTDVDSMRRKKLRKQARLAVRKSSMSNYTPNPLRAELMRLISALHRHGAISSEERGQLKDELIASKTMSQLRALHEKITLDVGDSIMPKPKTRKKTDELVVPDINELLS